MKISAIVLAYKEGAIIGKALASLSFADEIIVIDAGNDPETLFEVKKYASHIISTKETDFSAIRTLGLGEAHGEWLFYVDADEAVSPKLREEVLEVVSRSSDSVGAYELTRENWYLGHLWPTNDRVTRLIKKKSFVAWYGIVHESVKI